MADINWPRSFQDATALPADQVGALIEELIAVLDTQDGDTDLEATFLEDDFIDHPADGPGCPIADCREEDDHSGDPCDDGEPCEDDLDIRPIADPAAYREQVNRIRSERCYTRYEKRYDYGSWGSGPRRVPVAKRLFVEPVVPSKRSLLRRKRGVPRSPRP